MTSVSRESSLLHVGHFITLAKLLRPGTPSIYSLPVSTQHTHKLYEALMSILIQNGAGELNPRSTDHHTIWLDHFTCKKIVIRYPQTTSFVGLDNIK